MSRPLHRRSEPNDDGLESLFDRAREPMHLDLHHALAKTEARLFQRRPSLPTLGRYVLRSRIGTGGHGVVHEAYDPELDRKVAIKLIHGDDVPRDDALLQEARAASRVSHTHVVEIYDVGRYTALDLSNGEGHPQEVPRAGIFLVMELLEGGDLGGWIIRTRPPWGEIVDRFVAAASGLAAAHDGGTVHLDFKPQNVLLTADGVPKVVDFGLARVHRPRDPIATLGGTLAYMAPEQHPKAEMGPPGPEADQFALCAALYEALAGRRPYPGQDHEALLRAKRAGPPRLPGRRPNRLHRALRRGLAPDPSDRFGSIHALIVELRWSRRASTRWLLAGSGGVAIGLAAIAVGRSPPCSAVDDEMAEVWNPERRQALRSQLIADPAPYAGTVATAVLEDLDAQRSAWVDARRRSCLAQLDADASLRPAATLCLDAARSGFDEAVDILETMRPGTIDRAHRILDAMPPVERCVTGEPQPPVDDATLAEILAIERLLIRARSVQEGDTEAIHTASEAVARARTLDRDRLLARARIALGRAQLLAADLDGSAQALYDAVLGAERAGDDPTAVLALATLARVRGAEQHRFEDARQLLAMAEAKLDRGGVGWWPRAQAALALGSVEVHAKRPRDAVRALDEARQLLGNHLGPEHPSLDEADRIAARAWFEVGDEARANRITERRARRLRARLGPDHPETLAVEGNLAVFAKRDGRYADALAIVRRVVEGQQRSLTDTHQSLVTSRHQLAVILLIFGRFEESAAVGRVVLKARLHRLSATDHDVIISRAIVAEPLAESGALESARAHIEPALAMLDEHHLDSRHTVMVRVIAADIERIAGRYDAAAAHLASLSPAASPPSATTMSRFDLWSLARARVELACARQQPARGIALATETRLRLPPVEPFQTARLDLALAQCHADAGDFDAARTAAERGLTLLRSGGVTGPWVERLETLARRSAR